MRFIIIRSFIRALQARPARCNDTRVDRTLAAFLAQESLCRRMVLRLLLLACLSTLVVACDSDLATDTVDEDVSDLPESAGDSSDLLALELGDGAIVLEEGAATATDIPVSISRQPGAPANVRLSAALLDSTDEAYTSLTFSDDLLSIDETSSTLSMQLAIASRPILSEVRTLIVTASDENGTELLSASIDFSVTPTDLPDLYLLVGQSNMVGFSEDDSKRADSGEADEPVDRIFQLNVTGNDGENFASTADFTNPASNFNEGLPLTQALDPLHDGFDTSIDGKEGQRIGPGLSFAKRALVDTTADIYLIPAAWSDTGFCSRDTNRFEGSGWNASQTDNEALSGTLLYDRAITRANIALSQTNGILRGILWHQGEADSDDQACAEVYAENLVELASALRSNIDEDARGSIARGDDADVPFIVGTMSQGSDDRGDMLPFNDSKQMVDDVHRNVASLIPLADVVINDDLIPPDYPCGEGSCIHFGAAAYREMGHRYYETLIRLLP